MAEGPPTEIHAFSKYSFRVGVYPLENHRLSTKYDRQRFAHCHENNNIDYTPTTCIEQLTSILFLAYRFLNVGESIQAMIFENIKDYFISKVKHGKIANLHVLWKVLHCLHFPSAQKYYKKEMKYIHIYIY
jgi:hypothetical protein